MNALFSSGDSRLSIYAKSAGSLVPAAVVWSLFVVFVFPKLQQLCRDTGFADETLLGFQSAVEFVTHHGMLMTGGVLGIIALLEWRSRVRWPRCRRVSMEVLVFVLNSGVLALLFFMLCTAVVVAASLVKPH